MSNKIDDLGMPWVEAVHPGVEGTNEKQRRNRDYARHKIQQAKDEMVRDLLDKIASLQLVDGCTFCNNLPSGAHILKHGCDYLYGLKVERDVVSCPECARVLAYWEG